MLATEAPADHRIPCPPAPYAETCADGDGREDDPFAPMRGIVRGSLLGAACLGVLALAGWLLF